MSSVAISQPGSSAALAPALRKLAEAELYLEGKGLAAAPLTVDDIDLDERVEEARVEQAQRDEAARLRAEAEVLRGG